MGVVIFLHFVDVTGTVTATAVRLDGGCFTTVFEELLLLLLLTEEEELLLELQELELVLVESPSEVWPPLGFRGPLGTPPTGVRGPTA